MDSNADTHTYAHAHIYMCMLAYCKQLIYVVILLSDTTRYTRLQYYTTRYYIFAGYQEIVPDTTYLLDTRRYYQILHICRKPRDTTRYYVFAGYYRILYIYRILGDAIRYYVSYYVYYEILLDTMYLQDTRRYYLILCIYRILGDTTGFFFYLDLNHYISSTSTCVRMLDCES